MSSIGYRPDIDGLRGVAVLAVVLFHAGFAPFSGGYVGVDIFFVISGYLITAILLREMQIGNFRFRAFYARRARRLLPALFATLIATLVTGYFLLLPGEMIALGQASLATIFFGSNIYFWDKKTTYFGLDVETEPLLHTWSLGVEEQFYILFPLILLFTFKALRAKDRGIFVVLTTLLSVSLAANLWLTPFYTKFSFYMISNRAWEFLAGSLLALPLIPALRRDFLANLLALAGLVSIGFAIFSLEEDSLFPGYNALLPVIGTALIVHTGKNHKTWVHHFLCLPPVLFCGLISYSLYLWHWPATVYINMLWGSPKSPYIILLVSLGLGAASWHFIEKRYRHTRRLHTRHPSRHPTRELSLAGSLVVVASLCILLAEGLPGRIDNAIYTKTGIPRTDNDHEEFLKSCTPIDELVTTTTPLEGRRCALGAMDGPARFALWGDSHALALYPALNQAARELGVSGWLFNQSGCRALLGVYRESQHKCRHFNDSVAEMIAQNPQVHSVFLAGYWRIPLTGKGYDNNNFLVMDKLTREQSPAENARVFARGLARTVDRLPEKTVYLVEDVPEIGSAFGKEVASHFLRAIWLNTAINPTTWQFEDPQDTYDRQLKTIRKSTEGLRWVTIKDILCKDDFCPLYQDGRLLYADGDHLSHAGSLRLKDTFKTILVRQINN